MSFKHNLPAIESGVSYSEVFIWWTADKDGARTAVLIDGYEGRLMAKKKASDHHPILDWSTASGNIHIAGNRVEIKANALATKGLEFTDAVYDLLLWPPSEPAKAVRFCYGTISAKKVVTELPL